MWWLARLSLAAIAALLLAACVVAEPAATPSPTPVPDTQQEVVHVILDYASVPYEQIIDDSEAIFLGQVVDISPTNWNQDSGEYWHGGLPVHTIEARVLQRIVDSIELADEVTVTQVGYSPLEGHYSLAAGQRAVFFIVRREIAWRTGLLPVLRTTNTPWDSIIVVGDARYPDQTNGEAARLDKVLQDIAARRDILPATEQTE
jgi:hypothetical protein